MKMDFMGKSKREIKAMLEVTNFILHSMLKPLTASPQNGSSLLKRVSSSRTRESISRFTSIKRPEEFAKSTNDLPLYYGIVVYRFNEVKRGSLTFYFRALLR